MSRIHTIRRFLIRERAAAKERRAILAMLTAHAEACEAELTARGYRIGSRGWLAFKGDANLTRMLAGRIERMEHHA